MAKRAGRQAHRQRRPAYAGSVTSTKLKVSGIDVFSAGDFAGGDDGRGDRAARRRARRLQARRGADDKLVGAVLYGDTADGAWYFDLLKTGEDISRRCATTLIFGQAFAGRRPADPTAAVAALPDDAEICGCNGVCKGKIVAAIASRA